MGNNRLSARDIRCAMLWRLARSHGWAHWVPEERLIRSVPSHERGRARESIAGLSDEAYVHYQPDSGLKIAHQGIDRLARELRDACGISELRIESTLSHFRGFE